MGERVVYTGFWWENLRERDSLKNPGVDGRIILKFIFKKWDGAWAGLNGRVTLVFRKMIREFLDYMRTF
jgi:hypothetical protein